MERDFEKWLREAFDAPAPSKNKKEKFLEKYCARQTIAGPKKAGPVAMMTQIRYIRKYVWAVSFLVFLTAVIGIAESFDEITPVIAVVMPFVSGIAVLESVRSKMHGMDELEAVTRFSLRGILFARFVLIGISHMILLSVLVILLGSRSDAGYLLTGVKVTVPYLLSSVLGMEAERRTWGRKHAYVCMAVSAAVAAFVAAVEYSGKIAELLDGYRSVWFAVLIVLLAANLAEYKKCCMEAQPNGEATV